MQEDTDIAELVEATSIYQAAKARILAICNRISGRTVELPAAPKAPTIAQVPSEGTCWTCLWFGGKICQRHGSPRHNEHVDPAIHSCEMYKHTNMPRGELIRKFGEPEHDGAVNKLPDAAICDSCGHKIKVSKTGKLFQHDIDGYQLRGGLGDKTKICSGKPKVEEATDAA